MEEPLPPTAADMAAGVRALERGPPDLEPPVLLRVIGTSFSALLATVVGSRFPTGTMRTSGFMAPFWSGR